MVPGLFSVCAENAGFNPGIPKGFTNPWAGAGRARDLSQVAATRDYKSPPKIRKGSKKLPVGGFCVGKPYQGVSPWRFCRHLLPTRKLQAVRQSRTDDGFFRINASLPRHPGGVASGLSAPHPDPFLLFEKKGGKKANKGGDAPP